MPYIGSRFINSSDLVGLGIDWVTHSEWDHFEFWFDAESMPAVLEILKSHGMTCDYPSEGGYLGAHAGSGIAFRGLNYCTPSRERRYRSVVSDAQFEPFVVSSFGKIGTLYNYKGTLGILARAQHLTDTTREFCSEYGFDELVRVPDWWDRVLNALDARKYLITPETLHLSPLFIGKCIYQGEI